MNGMLEPSKNYVPSVRIDAVDSNLEFTYILEGKVKQHFAEWEGHLSLKTFSRGHAFYSVGAGNFAVDDRSFLVVNQNQPYSITVDADPYVESFIIFFRTGFAEEVNRKFTEDSAGLLDNPFIDSSQHIEFVPRLYSRSLIEIPMQRLRTAVRQMADDEIWLHEQLHEIMSGMLAGRRESLFEIERLSAIRSSTRDELYKRTYRAYDFIGSSFRENLSLQQISRVACLSPNHLLRSFKQIFCQTPHQYLTSLRLREATKLLEESEFSITTICHAVGFQSPSSFSLLFQSRFGISPKQYRLQKVIFDK